MQTSLASATGVSPWVSTRLFLAESRSSAKVTAGLHRFLVPPLSKTRIRLWLRQELLYGREQVVSPDRLLEGAIGAHHGGGLQETESSGVSPTCDRDNFGRRGHRPQCPHRR